MRESLLPHSLDLMLPSELLDLLLDVRRHYDARTPAVPASIELPDPIELTSPSVQEWLVERLIQPESTLAAEFKTRLTETDGEVLELGSISWRKSFWKRVVSRAEEGLRSAAQDEVGRAKPAASSEQLRR